MLTVLRHPVYARLFAAQVIALLGTGLLTVALGLLAYDLAGPDAGVVLGTALTVKILAYVAVSPVAAALTAHLPRRAVLITADLVRAALALCLPFVTAPWQVYAVILVLQAASATFTPTFQALIPAVLPDERGYTRALSLSRLAYDLEALVSPALAAALLAVVDVHSLFAGTVVGFLASAALVASCTLPPMPPTTTPAPFRDRLTRGVRLFWARRELRGLLGLDLAVAAPTALVLVSTVVLVQAVLGRTPTDVAWLLAAYGAGSMVVALGMPGLLERLPDRRVMLADGAALPVLLLAAAAVPATLEGTAAWTALLVLWPLLGAATSLVLTPSARLLRRGGAEEDRPAVFAAQFSLSHACYLVTYPVAGVLGTAIGVPAVAVVLAGVAAAGLALTVAAWRGEPARPAQRREAAPDEH